jgi:beta-glucosidase-like glycosyl hydrolase
MFLDSAQQAASYMALQLTADGVDWGFADQAPMFAPAVLGSVPMNMDCPMVLPAGSDIVLLKANGGASPATLNADATIFYYGPSTLI